MQNYVHELVVIVNLAWLAISLKREVTTVASFRKAFHIHFLTSYDEVEHFSPSAV